MASWRISARFFCPETLVEVSAGEIVVHPKLVHLLAEFLAEVAHRNQILALLALGLSTFVTASRRKLATVTPGMAVGY